MPNKHIQQHPKHCANKNAKGEQNSVLFEQVITYTPEMSHIVKQHNMDTYMIDHITALKLKEC